MNNLYFLENFQKIIKKKVKNKVSFLDFYNENFLKNIKFNTNFDFDNISIEVNDIKDCLDIISNIINKPLIHSSYEDNIVRISNAGGVSKDSLINTIKDSSLWRLKNNKPSPEYIHKEEAIDTIVLYENQFTCFMLEELGNRIENILNELGPINTSIEQIFETRNLSYGRYSILNQLSSFSYPYSDILVSKKLDKVNIIRSLKRYIEKIRVLKNTNFYKIVSKSMNQSFEIHLTNVLIHNHDFNFLYKYYKKGITNQTISRYKQNNVYYYNYCIFSMFKYLMLNKVGKTSLNKKQTLSFDPKNDRLTFNKLSFKKKEFSFLIEQIPSENAVTIEVRFISKAIRSDTKVKEYKKARYYLLFVKDYNNKTISQIEEISLSNAMKYDDVILVTLNNQENLYNKVLKLSYYDENNLEYISNLFKSFTMLFDCKKDIYETICPVCGKTSHYINKENCICDECKSKYSILKDKNNDVIWVKTFRRVNYE